MVQCVVIADDLTGANATGVMLKKLNLKTISLMNLEKIELKSLSNYDVITYPTDSRSVDKEIAYNRVYNVAKLLKSPNIKLYNKRIDSTLRGNLGAEIDAILDGLGDDRIAMVVPAFPQAGRTAVGGYLLVNGTMLQKTDAARDPRNPINTSVIEGLVAKQTKYKVKSIFLDTVYSGEHNIKNEILKAVNEGNRIIVVDALQVEDLDTIASAVVESGISFVTVDPGPFTEVVARKVIASKNEYSEDKILMSIGSVSSLTKIQIEEIKRAYSLYFVEISAKELVAGGQKREEEISRVASEILANIKDYDLFCVITNTIYPENRLDFTQISLSQNVTEEDLSLRINDGIAEITHKILGGAPEIKGVFSSGGDITVAVCRRFKSSGMELLHEVFPLVAYGVLEGGDFPNIKIVTKGGMVGDKDGMKKCIQFFKEQINVK